MSGFGFVQSKFSESTSAALSYDAPPGAGHLLVAAMAAGPDGTSGGLRIVSAGWTAGTQSPTYPDIRMFYKIAETGEPSAVYFAGYAYSYDAALLEYTMPGRSVTVAEGARNCGVVQYADSPTVTTNPGGNGLIVGFARTFTQFSNPSYRELVNGSTAGVVLRADDRPNFAVWDLITRQTTTSYKATFDTTQSANEGDYAAAIMAFVASGGGSPFWM